MNIITCKQLEKYKDKNGKIIGYRLVDTNGNQTQMKAEDLKAGIRAGNLNVVNLTLTKDGRLVDGAEPKEPKAPAVTQREADQRKKDSEVIDFVDSIQNKEQDTYLNYNGVLAEVRQRNNKVLGYIVKNGGIEFDTQSEIVEWVEEDPEALPNVRLGANNKIMVCYTNPNEALEIQKLISKQVIKNIPKQSPVKIEEEWEVLSYYSDECLKSEYGDFIKIGAFLYKVRNQYNDFEKRPFTVKEIESRMKEHESILDYIMYAKNLIKRIVMRLCRSFNNKIFKVLSEDNYYENTQYIDFGDFYYDLQDYNIEKTHEVPEYDLYKAVMTTNNRDKAIEMLKLLKYNIVIHLCRNAYDKTRPRGTRATILVKLFKECISKLNIVPSENELIRVIEVISLDDYKNVQTKELVQAARAVCKLNNAYNSLGKDDTIITNYQKDNWYNKITRNIIRLFVDENWDMICKGDTAKQLLQLKMPYWFDGCYKIRAHINWIDNESSYIVNSREKIMDAIVEAYESDLESMRDITDGEKENIVDFLYDIIFGKNTVIEFITSREFYSFFG